MAKGRSRNDAPPELTREAVLRFIADNPGRASKRDIAKAFAVKGDGRVALKDLLADLQAEGLLAGSRKRFSTPGVLPPVAVLEIRSRDDDGGLLAEPVSWDEAVDGERPRLAVRQDRAKGPAAGLGERILASIEEDEGGTRFARIIRILEQRKTTALGVFRARPGGGGRVEPVERKQPEYAIKPGDENGARDGDLVAVEPGPRARLGLPFATVTDVVGSMESERAISTIALHAHSIPHVFPKAVLSEAEAAGPASMDHREDWRSLPLVTIDPADAKDHDDAVHAVPDDDPANPGGMVVTVAIADVSYYVRPGTKLDSEARLRGNSVYFPDRVVPMLPERISNDLCSLRDNVDRPALAVRMVLGADGEKRRHSFHRVMMRSHAKIAYEAAQAAIDGATGDVDAHVTETMLKPLWAAYALARSARERRQPLDLDLPERKLKLGPDGRVEKVVVPARLDAHRLIEEFMILANVAAAESLESKRQALIYRAHDAPSLAKLESLREFLRTLEISLAKSGTLRPSHFNGILSQVKASEHESLVNEVVLRSQSQAVYSPDNIGHFGLNLDRYAHFTSPIRRYADLIVHRALVTAFDLGEGGLSREDEENLQATAEEISRAERRAMAAERDTVDRLIAHHLADRIGDDFEGRIAGVTKAGLFVALPAFGADGFVPISTLGNEFFHYDEVGRSLVGDRSGNGYRLGDTVEIRLKEAIPLAGSMQFEMLSEPRKLPREAGSFHKTGRKQRFGRREKNVAGKVRKKR
ncbi:VacB and RNase II family 3'-5' exoribonucleases [Aurantimonas manganoxydans SI85-9A1]|uniref:Ribonuclease R n=1 Tax=Aurantimonas manganoxydans (strain ATCC BAA-1229 / DSM 21871 / SI85-9A1) TaxID=287752 RepID=Q1YNI0_AURMS|nr:ribonuclease R [Aurantimonas manganoxydans]EAS51051.1 VacB and RNase II family 3'-5' exoribonucleases [Aurantimonas manganoxydans SI85-9A1]